VTVAGDVGQLLWVGFHGTEAPVDLYRRIAAGEVGAVVLFKRNLLQVDEGTDLAVVAGLVDALHAAGDHLLVAVDQEGGRVQRVRAPATVWPPMLQFDAAPGDAGLTLARRVGAAMGAELAALGFDIDFAPVLDVHTNPANPIIGDRAFSVEPERAAALALALADGLGDSSVLACGKHFPGHGDTQEDSHLALPRIDHDLERLRRVELVPFARAAAAGIPMIMTAHVVFAAVDPDRPATLSPRVIGDILRGELGYRGVIVSDDLDMKAVADHYGVADAAVAAVAAGCDALLLCADRERQEGAREALIGAAEADAVLRARVGEAAARVRALARSRGAVQRPPLSIIGAAEHRELAAELAALGPTPEVGS